MPACCFLALRDRFLTYPPAFSIILIAIDASSAKITNLIPIAYYTIFGYSACLIICFLVELLIYSCAQCCCTSSFHGVVKLELVKESTAVKVVTIAKVVISFLGILFCAYSLTMSQTEVTINGTVVLALNILLVIKQYMGILSYDSVGHKSLMTPDTNDVNLEFGWMELPHDVLTKIVGIVSVHPSQFALLTGDNPPECFSHMDKRLAKSISVENYRKLRLAFKITVSMTEGDLEQN
jgi:hypothetical protein